MGNVKPIIIEEMKNCDIHGEYNSLLSIVLGIVIWTGCPKCIEENEDRQTEIIELKESEDRKRRIKDALYKAGIPERFKNCTLENYDADLLGQQKALKESKTYIKNYHDIQKTGSSMFYCGSFGTGKTHLAIAVLKKLIETKIQAGKYTTTLRMIRDIRSSYRGGDYSEQQLIDKYINYPLLVLDEVGVQFGTEGEKILLFEVINGRYEDYKPTILLSNLTIKEMEKYLGEKVIDRLKSKTGSLVIMDWESHRNK